MAYKAYYSFNWTLNDLSWNWNNLTEQGTFISTPTKMFGSYTASTGWALSSSNIGISWSWNRTLWGWFRENSSWTLNHWIVWWWATSNNAQCTIAHQTSWGNKIFFWWWYQDTTSKMTYSVWTTYHQIAIYNWTTVSLYKNWVFDTSEPQSLNTTDSTLKIWYDPNATSYSSTASFSQIFVDDSVWSVARIKNDYAFDKWFI